MHCAEAAGGGVPTPQTLVTPPPPQVCGAVQAPQVSVPPQPFGIVPQFLPCAAQVVGVQAGGGGGGGGAPPFANRTNPSPKPEICAYAPSGTVMRIVRQANVAASTRGRMAVLPDPSFRAKRFDESLVTPLPAPPPESWPHPSTQAQCHACRHDELCRRNPSPSLQVSTRPTLSIGIDDAALRRMARDAQRDPQNPRRRAPDRRRWVNLPADRLRYREVLRSCEVVTQ